MNKIVNFDFYKVDRLHQEARAAIISEDYAVAMNKLRESLKHIEFIKARRER